MKKLDLLKRIEKLEAELQDLRIQVAGMKTQVPVNPWKVPYPNHPPYIAPDTNLPSPRCDRYSYLRN